MAISAPLNLTNSPPRNLLTPEKALGGAVVTLDIEKVALQAAVPMEESEVQLSAQALTMYGASVAAAATPTYTVTKALSMAATASAGSIAIADSAANISKNFDKLVAISGKISAIKQTDITAVSLTQAQFAAGISSSPQDGLLAKINNGQFKVAISGVSTANLNAIASYGNKVAAITVADTSANISANIKEILDLGSKVGSVTQTSKSAIALSYADMSTYASVLSKIDKGNYTLNLTDTANNIQKNLSAITKLGAKVSTISQTDTTEAIKLGTLALSSNVASLNKINGGSYKVSLVDTSTAVNKNWTTIVNIKKNIDSITLTDAKPELALNAAQTVAGGDVLNKLFSASVGLVVTDSAANISNNLSGLLALNDKIKSVRQSAAGNLAVTQNQLVDATFASFTRKLNPAAFTLAVSGVDKENLSSVVANSRVKTVQLNISDGVLSSDNPSTVAALASSKITAINISNAKIDSIAALGADKRVKSIAITDSSENFAKASNLVTIDALMKKSKGIVSAINLSGDTRGLMSVSQADYAKYATTVFSIPKNFALEVDLGMPAANTALSQSDIRSALKTTANSNGSFGVQVWDFTKGVYKKAVTLNAGVNFVKLGNTSTILDSGDAKLNAVLNVGSYSWQQNPNQAIAGTSDYELKPGVFALGSSSANTTITYKFLNSNTDPSLSARDQVGFAVMNADQKSAVVSALNYISSFVNINFQRVDEKSSANINFGTNDQGSTSGGYATGANPLLGAVNLMLNNKSAVNIKPMPGDYGWETIIHEIGHTLGLKHPGAYNAGGGVAPGPYLSATDDNRRNTIMSYKAPTDATTNWVAAGQGFINQGVSPSTFMPLDILALQYLYGKNQTGTSLSDSSKGLDDYQTTRFDAGWMGMQTLSSTAEGLAIDLSNVSASNIVDMRAGAFSSINIKDSTYNAGIGGAKAQTFFNLNNVGLAHDASIRSLVGGSSKDIVYVTNKDVEIDGGDGSDTVFLYGNSSDWTRTENASETIFTNGSVTAKLKNVELVSYYAAATRPTLNSRIDLTA